jgi:predicted TIM-barrel fold metal-dependent hydrolase
MVIDFQHHYVPAELAKRRGLYSETKNTMLEEGGLPATTMHRRLYDLELQLEDMEQAGIDISVLSCSLGWSAPLEECRIINDDLAAVQSKYPRQFVGLAQAPLWEGRRRLPNCVGQSPASVCAA